MIYSNNVKKCNWAIIYGTLNKNKHALIPENMLINNVYCSDKQTIDDEFKKIFTSSLEGNLNEAHHDGQNYTDYLNRNVLSNFKFH